MKLIFSSFMTAKQNKLECLSLDNFSGGLIYDSKPILKVSDLTGKITLT